MTDALKPSTLRREVVAAMWLFPEEYSSSGLPARDWFAQLSEHAQRSANQLVIALELASASPSYQSSPEPKFSDVVREQSERAIDEHAAASPSIQSSPPADDDAKAFQKVSDMGDEVIDEAVKEMFPSGSPPELKEILQRLNPHPAESNCMCAFCNNWRHQSTSIESLFASQRVAALPTELNEALDAYRSALRGMHKDLSEEEADIAAARSRLEGLFREQREEIERLSRRLDEWQEAEASVCPEDWGFVEYIRHLEKSGASLKKEQLTPEEAEAISKAVTAHWTQVKPDAIDFANALKKIQSICALRALSTTGSTK